MEGEGPVRVARGWMVSHRWLVAFAATAVLIIVRNLTGLSSAPPGLYNDEASIGYNAWAISHYGVDEHGAANPLYFQAFGEWKNPVYVYVLAALLRVLPLTVFVERLPAALFGLVVCAAMTASAWRLTRSRGISLLTLAIAGVTPWLVVESRIGFEVSSLLACLAATIWFLALADGGSRWWFAASGVALGIGVFAYSTGRVESGLFVGALAVAFGWPLRRHPGWWLALLPVGVAYLVLWRWSIAHPGGLTGRYDLLSVGYDHAPLSEQAVRFLDNYGTYFNVPFLLTHGDTNLRHNSGFGGMLLLSSAPLVVAGVVVCIRRWRQALPRFTLLGTLAAPVSASLTMEGSPHSLRASALLPFALLLVIFGLSGVWDLLRHQRAMLVALCAALAVEGGLFTIDLYRAWPHRSAAWFDAGQVDAVRAARDLAGDHRVLLSRSLDEPYIEAFFVFQPPPPPSPERDDPEGALAAVHVQLVDVRGPEAGVASPGDVLVLSGDDPAPKNAELLVGEYPPPAPDPEYRPASPTPLVRVYLAH